MKKLILLCACALLTMAFPAPAAPDKPPTTFVCPDCGCASDAQTFEKAGICPSCGMKLIEKGQQKEQQKVTVAVLLFDGAQIIDYAGPWEAFGEAGFKVYTVAENATPVHAVFGQTITPDYTFANSPAADILLVPGGSTKNAVANAHLIQWVQKTAAASKHVMSVCTGAFILARAGLLDGLTATTVSHAIDQLAQESPRTKVVADQRYVDNGKIITTAGLSSGIDGAFHLIAKIKGKGAAEDTALGMEYRWDPDSKFARAALADMHFPQIDGIDAQILSTEGDADHWEFKALLSQPNSAAGALDLLARRVVAGTPHTRGPVTLLPSKADASEKQSEVDWTFTDEQGAHWQGSGMAESAKDQPGKLVITLRLKRESAPKTS